VKQSPSQHYNAHTRFRTNLITPESIDDTHTSFLWRIMSCLVTGSDSSSSSLTIKKSTGSRHRPPDHIGKVGVGFKEGSIDGSLFEHSQRIVVQILDLC
jgi:hypothetical protein